MAGKHAKYSPSGAEGWSNCSDWASDPTGSDYANWGTAGHDVAARAMTTRKSAADYLGEFVKVDGKDYLVDDDMTECVQSYIDTIYSLGGTLFVEQKLSIEHVAGEADATGTADAVVTLPDELVIADLKTGKGVQVDAEGNKQLAIYASAAVKAFELVADFSRVRLMIVQPRMHHVSEWALTVDELNAFVATIKPATTVTPGEDQCRWCAKKATCTALAEAVASEYNAIPVSAMEIAQSASLGHALSQVDLIEDWCKAVRGEVERRLLAGQTVPGFKLVQGKKGNRAWDNAVEVEAMLKAMRLKVDEMYDFKLISPTTAEKVLKANPIKWAKVQERITQKPGGPSVAPATDKRPALNLSIDPSEFTAIPETV